MKFSVSGTMSASGRLRKFAIELEAPSEATAKQWTLSKLGSHNGVRRSNIKISKIEKVA
ncbi:hypothetical protein HY990_04245 [Candidatus Micrarchaeota archaeon]|nr:hypothetical protein [Candidatus Micrarchaeota archaeon]